MELILDIKVNVTEYLDVKGSLSDIAMIMFTAETAGKYFNGKTIGAGVDTQKKSKDGKTLLSARYMLEGTDFAGEKCRVFIENNGSFESGFTPVIVTDSKALSHWESTGLSAEVIPAENGGVNIKIYILS